MNKYIKKFIKKSASLIGFDIHRITVDSNPDFQLLKALQHHHIDLVFDIGANAGQFAEQLRFVGYSGTIVSFEPLPDVHQTLTKSAASDSLWYVHERSALGNIDGEININIAGNSVSSSVLPMLEMHSLTAADSAYIGTINTPITKLDSVASPYLHNSGHYFIKIDTQGFEWQVLDGARETLKKARGVLCELSLVPLYEGQYLWLEIIDRLKQEGFSLWSLQQVFCDHRNGRTLQVDAIFFRP